MYKISKLIFRQKGGNPTIQSEQGFLPIAAAQNKRFIDILTLISVRGIFELTRVKTQYPSLADRETVS